MKRRYIDPGELADALEEAQRLGNRPTERLCRLFRKLAEHMTGSPRFSRYSEWDKADMVSASLEKLIRNIKNYRPERRASAFSYCTMCCEQGFVAWLILHYKFANRRRDAALAAAARLEAQDPVAAAALRERFPRPEGGDVLENAKARRRRRAERRKKETGEKGGKM